MIKSQEEDKNDLTPNSTHILQLKYNNPEGDSSIGFRYSKYKESDTSKEAIMNSLQFENMTVNNGFWKQTRLMTWKNFLIFSRNFKPTMFQLLTPIAICLILIMLQQLVNNFTHAFIDKDPEVINLNKLEKCLYPEDCITLGFGIISANNKTSDVVESVMTYVAEINSLEYSKDVKLLTIGDSDSYLNYLTSHQNKTKFGVLFCLDNMEFLNVSIPCTFEFYNATFHLYTILYNVTNVPNGFLTSQTLPFPKDPELTKLKLDIDNAYLSYYAEKRNLDHTPKINATMKSFPITQNRFLEKADVTASTGAFYFFFPPMISFVVILLEIIREKDLKLRKSLLIIGLKNSSFWFSWFITSVFFAVVVSLILVLFGMICDFDVFVKSPFIITFLLFFTFNLTMQFLAYFLTTILKSMNSAYTVTYAFILIGLVMEIFLSNYAIIYYLYSTDLPWWVGVIKFVFELYPPFNFSKAYSDIAIRSASHFDNYEWRWVKGPGYALDDFFKRIKGSMRFDIYYDVPSTAETIGMFFLDILLFIALAWYFDHVDSSNRGKTYGKFFFLEKNYWCKNNNRNSLHNNEINNRIKNEVDLETKSQMTEQILGKDRNNQNSFTSSSFDSDEESNEAGLKSVIDEKFRVIKESKNFKIQEGLRVLGCSKTYLLSDKFCGTKQVKALKDTYIQIPLGELFTILGHNGAGKSTLINILTGNISPTSGTATINNYDIIVDSISIEEYIGLCPQHDILWEELTASEHIELYANLRNYPQRVISKLIDSKLKEVNLLNQANAEVKTFSGGMKRRLSILLSTIGNPKVIFLDEPTTGLDPVNKRFIWSMIQQMKRNRAIILTTHSMEEADFLSDRIGVIVEGKFKCIGTPLDLKKIYGSGYLLTFVCDNNYIEKVKSLIKSIMPSSSILDSSGGSIILNLPFENVGEMKYFIAILNHNFNEPKLKPLEGLIKECGMNYTTLEEIFLKITTRRKTHPKINLLNK